MLPRTVSVGCTFSPDADLVSPAFCGPEPRGGTSQPRPSQSGCPGPPPAGAPGAPTRPAGWSGNVHACVPRGAVGETPASCRSRCLSLPSRSGRAGWPPARPGAASQLLLGPRRARGLCGGMWREIHFPLCYRRQHKVTLTPPTLNPTVSPPERQSPCTLPDIFSTPS